VLTLQNLETNQFVFFCVRNLLAPNMRTGILVVSIAYQAQGVISIFLTALAYGKARACRPTRRSANGHGQEANRLFDGWNKMKIWQIFAPENCSGTKNLESPCLSRYEATRIFNQRTPTNNLCPCSVHHPPPRPVALRRALGVCTGQALLHAGADGRGERARERASL
jgi:hypothetical protein